MLWDLDGVLVFSKEAWFAVYNDTLRHFGHDPLDGEAFSAIFGNGTEADRDTYMPERSIAEIDEAYRRFFEERLDLLRANPEAAPCLSHLREAGIACAVATNTNAKLAARILTRAGLIELVGATAGADEAGAGKPDPAVVRLAAQRLGRDLSECVFVGDSRYDEEAARGAGVRFIGFRYGSGWRVERLSEICA